MTSLNSGYDYVSLFPIFLGYEAQICESISKALDDKPGLLMFLSTSQPNNTCSPPNSACYIMLPYLGTAAPFFPLADALTGPRLLSEQPIQPSKWLRHQFSSEVFPDHFPFLNLNYSSVLTLCLEECILITFSQPCLPCFSSENL